LDWYQPIECDNTVKNPFVCDSDNFSENGFSGSSFLQGKEILSWNSSIFLQAKKKKNDGCPDDALQNHLMLPIFSSRLVKILQENIAGIQYLPVSVLNSKGQKLDGFSLANFLFFIEAFDYDNSEFNRFSTDFPNPNVRGKLAGVTKFVLKKERLVGLDVFRLRDYESRFFVSEKFKSLFEENRFSGYSFRKVDLT